MQKDDYQIRKEERRKAFQQLHGLKLVTCTACSGSGHYDHDRSPKCWSCDGIGKMREERRSSPTKKLVAKGIAPPEGEQGLIRDIKGS